LVAGDGNTLINTGTIGGPPVSSEELSELRQTIEALKAQVLAQAPPEKRSAAVERLDELHEAITADKPKLSTMEYVRDWFASNIPTMAGAVTAVVINPIVGRLVQAGGDALVSEFERRFG
jgi:hypothetical protein